jgi:hypothetical protein
MTKIAFCCRLFKDLESSPYRHSIFYQFLCFLYSAFNHKRVTAAKCRQSHHRRTEWHSSSCIRSEVVCLAAFCSGGTFMIERTVVNKELFTSNSQGIIVTPDLFMICIIQEQS